MISLGIAQAGGGVHVVNTQQVNEHPFPLSARATWTEWPTAVTLATQLFHFTLEVGLSLQLESSGELQNCCETCLATSKCKRTRIHLSELLESVCCHHAQTVANLGWQTSAAFGSHLRTQSQKQDTIAKDSAERVDVESLT